MAGQPTPPRILEAFALNAPACTPAAPIAGGKTAPFPAASQILVTDGAASLSDGFVPLNMTDPTTGGVPPFGVDMNGILYLITAWIAAIAAGQLPLYDATLQAAMAGYALGARLQQAANSAAIWVSATNGNMTNPDTGGAGWISSVPLYATTAPTAGVHVDNVLPGLSDYFIDVDTTAGNIVYNGVIAQRDGQRVTYSATGAGNFTLGFLSGTPANQVRGNGPSATILQNDSIAIQYCAAVSRWVVV